MESSKAKRGLAIYFALVLLGSGTCQALMIRSGQPITSQPLLALLNMWVPGIASIVTRLALREGFRDVSFSLPGRHGARMVVLAWLFPLAVGLVAYGFAWGTHLETFAAPKLARFGMENTPPLVRLAFHAGLMLTLGTVLSALSAAGEEIGWRGYMLTRLLDAGVSRPILVSAAIWASWHVPLIVSGLYAAGPHPALSAVLFFGAITAQSYVSGRARLESGSVWPAIVAHSSWNALLQSTFDGFTRGAGTATSESIWIGESGILVAIASMAIAYVAVRGPWPVRHFPGEAPTQSSSNV